MRAAVAAAALVAIACTPASVVASPPPTSVVAPFWDPDVGSRRPAEAFGALPPERQARRVLRVDAVELRTALPQVPPELDVYVAGSYDATTGSRVRRLGEHWEFVPMLSLVQYVGSEFPLGDAHPIRDRDDAIARSQRLLQGYGLLPDDTVAIGAEKRSDGTWRARFARRLGAYPDYANKGLAVSFGMDGRIRNVLGRRRPLLERSAYRTRTADDAWAELRAGRWRSFIVEDGAPDDASIDRFVVTSSEIAYVEGEVLSERDIVRPYYVFRDDRGLALYVSAIAGDGP